ncbi:MAG: hypothetical protein HC921_17775 [Synechococcaceae cyanobacterium SM2_3_1]|nr:hypothetical protein [Synechococcaceae cyanobacterium SM2_3_1]
MKHEINGPQHLRLDIPRWQYHPIRQRLEELSIHDWRDQDGDLLVEIHDDLQAI